MRPGALLKLLYWRLHTHAKDFFSIALQRIVSKPGVFRRARFRADRGATVAQAKALHRTMSEALAAGDTDALQAVVTDKLFLKLSSAVALRPRGRRLEWRLVRYTRPWWFPRVVDHKVISSAAILPGSTDLIRQVVVAIASRQRLVEYDANNRVVSDKEVDVVENIALMTTLNNTTFEDRGWRITGQLPETTPEAWDEERRVIEQLSQGAEKAAATRGKA